MAECFCGCGVKVGALQMQRKSANRMGATVADSVGQLERDVLPAMDERARDLDDPEMGQPGLAMADDLLAAGKHHEATCRAVVHEEEAFAHVGWSRMRAWVRQAQGMAAMFRLPPERQQQIIDRS